MRIRHADRMLDATLASKIEMDLRDGHIDVTITQRRQSVRIVVSCVFFVSDARQCGLQQSHDRGQYFLFRQSIAREVAFDARANFRKEPTEISHAVEFRFVAHLAPSVMIAILLAVSRVTANGLNVTFFRRTDPHIGPGGWNRERSNPRERRRIADEPAVRAEITKAFAGTHASYAGHAVCNVPQSRNSGRGHRVRCSESHIHFYGPTKTG